MWVYNIARDLLRSAGRKVFPEPVPQGDAEMMAQAARGLEDRNPRNVWVLKVHALVRADTPRSRFLVTHRDPRDALVSYMRFMRCDFEAALEIMANSTRACDYFRTLPPERTLHLEYRDLASRPREVLARLAEHLGLSVADEVAAAMVAKFSKKEVRRRIEAAQTSVRERSAAGEPVSPGEIVQVSPSHRRVFDLATGFQGGHVSDYRDGDWRALLKAAQQRRMTRVLGAWLERSAYRSAAD